MNQGNNPEDAIAAVEAWNRAWLARDLEGMKKIAADGLIVWQATVRKDLTKDEEFAILAEALKVMRVEFKDIRLTPMSGGAVLQQCVADIDIDGVGSCEGVPLAMVYQTRGQQITRCDEYMDGMALPRIDFTPQD